MVRFPILLVLLCRDYCFRPYKPNADASPSGTYHWGCEQIYTFDSFSVLFCNTRYYPPPLQIKSQTLYNRPALVNKELNKRFSLLSPALFICFNNTLCALAHNKIYLLVGEE